MEGAPGLVVGGKLLRRGGMEMRGKTGELLDAGDAAPWRRRSEWEGAPWESLWRKGESYGREEGFGRGDGDFRAVKKPCT